MSADKPRTALSWATVKPLSTIMVVAVETAVPPDAAFIVTPEKTEPEDVSIVLSSVTTTIV